MQASDAEHHVDEYELTSVCIERLIRETFQMLFDHDPDYYGDIVNFQNALPASGCAIEKLIAPSLEDLFGK